MSIDFQDAGNRRWYSGRDVDASWAEVVRGLVDPAGAAVMDIGCGGGAYTRGWSGLGAARVVGVDSSGPLLESALEDHGGMPGIEFRPGTAAHTALPAGTADVVFERALIHHIDDLAPVIAEARRLLRPGGAYLVQDRTPDDVALPGAPDHPRGYFFEVFPHLLEVENGRRRSVEAVYADLARGGFDDIAITQAWEVRRRYADRDEYLGEIAARTGRSILHELDDAELRHLLARLRERLPAGPLVERDRWTVWSARRP